MSTHRSSSAPKGRPSDIRGGDIPQEHPQYTEPRAEPETIRLLLYSEDRTALSVLRAALSADYDVVAENHEAEIKARLHQHQTDVLILDFDPGAMSLKNLLAFIGEIRELGVPILVMTDDARRSTAVELVEHGVYDYFRKPPHLAELRIIIRRAYEHSQLQFELKAAKQRLSGLSHCDHLVGTSEKMQKVYDLIRRVADLDANVVIRGESGTGKELVARAIHNLSGRSHQPFLAVPCGAIPETLIESEVFGYERGAFTGATQSKDGYFERVGSGTLFLDEMAEMSAHTQVKFLRVLQEREFSRVGGKKNYQLKARLLFATHRNLEDMVETGDFREDLYYRMHVVKLEIPPLRDRKEDIAALAEGFLRTYATAYGRPTKHLEPAALRVLERHDWPGNVRELENVVQRVVILSEAPLVRAEDLATLLHEPVEDGAKVHFIDAPFDYQVRAYKRRLVEAALLQSGGNKTKAAHKLGITRAYLHRILRQESITAEYPENHGPGTKQRAG